MVVILDYGHELMGLVCFPSVDARVPFISIIVGTPHLLGRFRHNAYFVVSNQGLTEIVTSFNHSIELYRNVRSV